MTNEGDYETYRRANQSLWDKLARFHPGTDFYDVPGFKAGQSALDPIVRAGVGNVSGKSLLHLQCHFGLDTLSWAREGAVVTGIDFSSEGIARGQQLASELNIPANFICSDLYDLPNRLSDSFDVVFTSYGALIWLPDIEQWARIIAHFLKPGGLFFIAEGHPFSMIFDGEDASIDTLHVRYPYFGHSQPYEEESTGTYADPEADLGRQVSYEWSHGLAEIVMALISAGLNIESLEEHSCVAWQMFPFLEAHDDRLWYFPSGATPFPLMFTIRARKKG